MRFPGFSGEWQIKKIREIASKINSGKTPLGGEAVYTNKGVLFIRSQNVNDNHLDIENAVFIPEEINNEMKNSIVYPNDILLNITGASLGRSCVVPMDFNIGNVNQHVCIIRLIKNNNPRFLQPYFSSNKGQNTFKSLQTGSGREGLNFESIKNQKVFIPFFSEQTKIATFLALLNLRIQTQNEIIGKYESLMKGLSGKLFIEKLRFKKGKENDFQKWQSKFGNEVFKSVSNKNHNSDLPILAISQEHGAIPRHLIDYNITVTDKSIDNYKIIEVGDFIISLRSFQGGIEYSEYKGICSPAYIILRPFIAINNLFFKYYFKTDKYITELNKKIEGIRDGKMISYKYFSEIKLPFPSLDEQQKISSFLFSINEKIKIEKSILNSLTNQKQYLLQQLLI
jgi:type I restriction enzyme S subunit